MADRLGVWGPATVDFSLSASPPSIVLPSTDAADIAAFIQPTLVHFNPVEVTVKVKWESGNEFGQPVTVKVSAPYRPMMTFIFGKFVEALRRHFSKHPDGVAPHVRPQLWVDTCEQFLGFGMPGPSQVCGECGQARQ